MRSIKRLNGLKVNKKRMEVGSEVGVFVLHMQPGILLQNILKLTSKRFGIEALTSLGETYATSYISLLNI